MNLVCFPKKRHHIARAQLWGEPGKEVCVHFCTKFDLIWKADCCRCSDEVTLASRRILCILPLKTASSDEKRGTSETHRHRQKLHSDSDKDCGEAFSSHRLPNTYDSHQTLGEARKDRKRDRFSFSPLGELSLLILESLMF